MMISFLAVMTLSFTTLYLGTYVAERLEARRCSTCCQVLDGRRGNQ
jgi:hypothetical protein